MFQQPTNIFTNSDIYNCTACIHDSRLGYQVTWDENNNLNGYSVVDGVTSYTTWDGVYFGVSVSGSCYISQDNDIDLNASDYNIMNINMRLDVDHHITTPTTGKLEFKTSAEPTWTSAKSIEFDITSDNAYHVHSIDLSTHLKWEGTVTRFRLYPMIDGPPGTRIHIKSIEFKSRSSYACGSRLGGSLCNKYSEYSNPCPWIGSPGSSISGILNDGITIVGGVNDKLLVNIDSYGNQAITLRPVVGARIIDIARDIQDKLNLVGVGGYSTSRCYVDSRKIKIESDWFDSESSVVVSQPRSASCATTLNFFDSTGTKVAVETSGTESATRYERAPLQLNSSSIRYLKSSNNTSDKSAFSVDVSLYSPQGGRSGYRTISRDTKLSFEDKTVIDYNNPIMSNGVIAFMGYSGDAFPNTEFRIYRQRLDGSVYLVSSVDMSEDPEVTDEIFEKSDISIKVKKGDLLALYSASIHTGDTLALPNASYVLYDGDLSSGTSIQPLSGSGELGLALYARGLKKSDKAIVEIDFEQAQLLESIVVHAQEDTVEEEVNLCTVRNGGLGGGPFVTGTTGLDINGDPSPDMENLSSLIDGDKQDINGTSTHCYPGWLDLPSQDWPDYDYTDFQIAFDFAKGVDVYFPIHRIKTYFVDTRNIKSFRWEIPTATNPQDTERLWGVGWDEYNQVYTEDGIMDSTSIYLYNNPSVLTAGDYQVAYAHLEYKYLELIFDSFRARSIRFNATIGDDPELDSLQLDYSYFPVSPSPKIEEIEVYAKFVPSTSIASSFIVESLHDTAGYLIHPDYDEISSTNVKYVVGRPVSKLRLTISADSFLRVYNIKGVLSEDPVTIETNYTQTMALNAPIDNPESFVEEMSVTNDSSSTSNFYVDILEEAAKTERCILWNKLDSSTSIGESEIGPGGIVRRRDSRLLRPYNYAYGCPGYYLDKNFIEGRTAYISLDNKQTWSSVGSTISDGSDSSHVTNESALSHIYSTVYVALSLGDIYNIDSVVLHNPDGTTGFLSSVLYSSKDTADPSDIPPLPDSDAWSVGSKSNARWALFSAPAVPLGDGSVRHLSYVDVVVDFSHSYNRGKVPWKSADGHLTNGTSGTTAEGGEEGWIANETAEYFCVNLMWWHNVSNVITGPMNPTASTVEDVDATGAGVFPSVVDSSVSSSDIAYSQTSTDNPAEVVWGSFGDPPSNPVRWVLVQTATRIEEIIVQVDQNEPNDKPSFLNENWFESSGGTLYQEFAETMSGICAIALDCPANSTVDSYLQYKQSLGYDDELSKRDVLSFWFYISDLDQLDTSQGYFNIGRSKTQANTPLDINLVPDTYNRYEWPLSELSSFLQTGWNYIQLPFSDNYKYGYLYIAEDDKSRIHSSYSTTRDRITNFKLLFRPITSNQSFTVRIDDMRIVRRHFSSGNFDLGAYVPKSEYIKFPLNDFNPLKGTIEFYIKPDWARSFLCNACNDQRDHALLRVFSPEDDSLFALFMTGEGLKFYVTDGDESLMATDNSQYDIGRDVPTHVALVWDFQDEFDFSPALGVYINNKLSVAFEKTQLDDFGISFSFAQRSLYNLILGATGWEGLVSSFSSSADAAIENIKAYNYPVADFTYAMSNQGFEQPKRSSELISLSLDNVNYYSSEDRGSGLPLFKQNVSAAENFTVYVRGRDLDETKPGEKNRRAYITVTRTPV